MRRNEGLLRRRLARRRLPRRATRSGVATALVGLAATLQGCVGVAVQTRHTETLDPVEVAEALRSAHASSPPSDALPRKPHRDERVDVDRRGERVTYTYRRDTSLACWHYVVLVPLPTPGCDDADVYVVERGNLVEARARRYPVTGFMCSWFFLAAPVEFASRDWGLCMLLRHEEFW